MPNLFQGLDPTASTVQTDGGGSLYASQNFYGTVPFWVTGIRIWNPVGADSTFLNTDVTAVAYGRDWLGALMGGVTYGSPTQSKVETAARVAGEWTTILFDTPIAVNAVSSSANSFDSVSVGYTFAGGTYYVTATRAGVTGTTESVASAAADGLFWAEDAFPKAGNSFDPRVTTWYGVDLVYSLTEPSTAATGTTATTDGRDTAAISGTAAAPNKTPQNLVATPVSATQVDLTWDAVAGVSLYVVERDGIIISSEEVTNAYSDTGLSPGTEYSYYVLSRL